MKKIRIMHLISSPKGVGGAEKLLADFDKIYDKTRFEFAYCNLFTDDGEPSETEKLLSAHGSKVFSLSGSKMYEIPFVLHKLRNLLNSEKTDILHSHLIHATIIGQIVGLINKKIKTVITRHYTDDVISHKKVYFFADKVATKRANKVIAISTRVKNELIEKGINDNKIEVILNGVEPENFNYDPRKSHHVEEKQDFKIFTIGNLFERKGHRFLIESLAEIMKKNRNIFIDIAGEGTERKALETLIDSLGLSNQIRLLGYISNVSEYLSNCDLYIHPSQSEAFGIAIIEAMATGKYVIATNVGGVSEIITNGENGALVEYNDKSQLLKLVVEALNSSELGHVLGKAARSTVEQRFNIRNSIESYQKLYLSLIN